jgi:hypothetical protein
MRQPVLGATGASRRSAEAFSASRKSSNRGQGMMFSDEDIREIFRRVAYDARHEHGDFLTYFAKSLAQADPENFKLLRPVAAVLIHKYRLMEELK